MLDIFKSQLKKKQKAVGEKTFFGKEITNEDKVLFFVFKNKDFACTLTKITETELPILEQKLILDKEDDKVNTLLGAFPVFKSK
jgi:hypothetical protein